MRQGRERLHRPGARGHDSRMIIAASSVLAALSADRAVSGVELARRLGVTRAAVWKQVEHLRELGAPVEAVAGSGYRLAWPLELLDAERIRGALDAPTSECLRDLAVHWQIDSTSTQLQRRAASATGIEACLAETQTAGRGRRGREWQSPLGGNLYFSLLRRFDAGMAALSGLSLVVGVAVVEALADVGVTGVGLKWPNDVLADGKKLAGILVELGGEFLGPCYTVIGIGINLRLPPEARARIDQPAIDVASMRDGEMPSRNALAARLIMRLVGALDRFEVRGFATFANDYARHDLLRDRPVRVLAAGVWRDGIAAGIDDRGALIVRHGDALTHYDSAEISVRAA
jgi:BirA family biotin operon repressor/biotin-[acetyl-CoA-carboxylase] ligase